MGNLRQYGLITAGVLVAAGTVYALTMTRNKNSGHTTTPKPGTPGGSSGGSSGGSMTEREKLINFARGKVGNAYSQNNPQGPDCYDCSGLMQAAYASVGKSIPRQVTEQAETAPRQKDARVYETAEALQNAMNPGDCLGTGFNEAQPHPVYGTRYKHVLMWTGNSWIHASGTARGIVEDGKPLSNYHFQQRRKIYSW